MFEVSIVYFVGGCVLVIVGCLTMRSFLKGDCEIRLHDDEDHRTF